VEEYFGTHNLLVRRSNTVMLLTTLHRKMPGLSTWPESVVMLSKLRNRLQE
jgi:hypothetical protein